MSFWIAKTKNEIRCDVCGGVIKKGKRRLVYGYKCLAYTMIDRNVCLQCYSGLNPNDLARKMASPLSTDIEELAQKLENFKKEVQK